jgi:hypothetical protein
MIPIITANIKFFHPLHLYQNAPEYNLDALVIGEKNDRLMYVVLDRNSEAVLTRHAIPYKSATTRLFNTYFPEMDQTDTTLVHAFGFYRVYDDKNLATIFIVQQHRASRRYYLAQCNILDHDTSDFELMAISKYLDVEIKFIDVMIRKSSIYTDTKSVSDYDTYIMSTSANAKGRECVDGIRVLVTDEDKVEFAEVNNCTLLPTDFPIVDQWTDDRFKFYDLPEHVQEHAFNFSTGMGLIRFSE